MKQEIVNINVFDIIPNRFQPRIKFDDNKLNELANSIRKYGILCPLILRKLGDKYEIIAGERRYKAALMIGMQTVPSIVMTLTDQESAEIALIENIQREDLSSIEEAKSYDNLIKKENLTKDQISQSISKNIGLIDSKLKLLDLSDKAKDSLLNNLISEGHAKVLLKLKDKNKQDEVLDKIINQRLNVKETSEEVKKINEQNTNIVSNNNINYQNINNFSNINQEIDQDIINIKNLNEPDEALKRENINNALNEINLDNKGEFNMNEFNNINNNMGINNIPENTQQNRFFPSLEDQTVNINNQAQNQGLAPNMFDQPQQINQQIIPEPTNTASVPSQELGINNQNIFDQVQPQVPNMFDQVQPQSSNMFDQVQPQAPNMFDQIQPQVPNMFDQVQSPVQSQPFEMPNIQTNIIEFDEPSSSNYGANFAPQINQSNPAIDKIKSAIAELKANGFNIEFSEADLMDSFQLIINIKK